MRISEWSSDVCSSDLMTDKPDRVLFQMWGPFREFLIADHQFYVTEAKRRLLDQFTDESIKADSDRFEREWLANRSSFFDPDRDDEGAIYEQAWDESIAFYERLDDLRNATRLSIIAGMYHEWEKQLRDWLGKDMGELRLGKHTHAAIRSEEHTSELQSLMRNSYAVFCLKKKTNICRSQN